MEELIYQSLPSFESPEQIEQIIATGDPHQVCLVPLIVGEGASDWRYAQSVCLQLADHSDPDVRANACLGLGYIARVHGVLDKRLVKPVLLRELNSQTESKGNIIAGIEDINHFLGWRIAHKHLE